MKLLTEFHRKSYYEYQQANIRGGFVAVSISIRLRRIIAMTLLMLFVIPSALMAMGKESGEPKIPGTRFFKPSHVEPPYYQTCTHRSNKMYLTISNFGIMGAMNESYRDCETNLAAPGCQYPAESLLDYLYATGLWIGAVVGSDTLVTTGWDGWQYIYETWPCAAPECGIQRRSAVPSSPYYDVMASSDFEYIAVCTDTLVHPSWTETDWDASEHKPLNLQITQTSYSWSVDYAEDFILIDYNFKNIGLNHLDNVYIGLQVDGDVSHTSRQRGAWTDDICGFKETVPSMVCPGLLDSINLAWIADNDGDPSPLDGEFDHQSVQGITGIRIMRSPSKNLRVAFNWWTSNGNVGFDWGPIYEANKRQFGTGGLGTPEGDANKYFIMSNGEHDYDQIFSAEDFSDQGWLPPSSVLGSQIAGGGDTRYLLSMGPYDIEPGDSLPLTIAYVGGENFHRNPSDFRVFMDEQNNPQEFYSRLDFSDVGENAVWANWIYDNPGVDTDGNSYKGEFCEKFDTLPNGEIVIDSVYYTGDGVPDFRAATAPPPPVLRATTTIGGVTLRWNGLITENAYDPFTRLQDFEGYKVYMGRLQQIDKLALLESRDHTNFKRLYWDSLQTAWEPLDDIPLTLDSLRGFYGQDFDPLEFGCGQSGIGHDMDGLVVCFDPVGWNESIDGWFDGADISTSSQIRKRFADEIAAHQVTNDMDSSITENWVKGFDPMTGDSIMYHKYYEYEFEIDNLLSSVPWYFSVTAFDFGDIRGTLGQLESSPLANVIEVWPINDATNVVERNLEVAVYPNPYIGDGRYVRAGYEDPNRTGFTDHERRIHFVNLPPRCRISIYTLDGDLVRSFDHPGSSSSADSKAAWNMRSRNNELVASGIYIFIVESEWGNQIGKIVLIL